MRCSESAFTRLRRAVIRDLRRFGVWDDPGSAAHHFARFVLRSARETQLIGQL